MRVVQKQQMTLGEVDISQIEFDLRSRDDMPRILRGLQALYINVPLREKIFALLDTERMPSTRKNTGRPGMALWHILVCGVVRLDLNIDYDHLHELVNRHVTLRQILGHGPYNEHYYPRQTLIDNITRFTPELLDKINVLIVEGGHAIAKKADALLHGRCDSFVVETDVHHPTDISLLMDAVRKVITLTSQWCDEADISDWRQSRYNLNAFKRLVRSAQNKKRGTSQSEEKNAQKEQDIVQAHQVLLDVANQYINKAQQTLLKLMAARPEKIIDNMAKKLEIEGYIAHAKRQIDQTERRVIKDEKIHHAEKVFSIFEPHTEWICKGKAGVPVELGLRVSIVEDQYQFILHHHVHDKQTDDAVAVGIVKATQEKFKQFRVCSFDKGFYSPANKTELQVILEQLVMPKKGKLSQQARAEEHSEQFIKFRHAHSAVESAINALEVHGLDKCPDHGIDGFKRYVALAVVARNIHRIGDILLQRDVARERWRKTRVLRTRLKQAA